jgi:diguanylate cyclase (GGDEF)-like protein
MAGKDTFSQLFCKELAVLQRAAKVSQAVRRRGDGLLVEYQRLMREYDKLLKSTQRIYRISDTQAKHLKLRENEIQTLLDHSNQGFLTFGPDLLVGREYSAECSRIFNKKIGGVNIVELLSATNPGLTDLFKKILPQVFAVDDNEAAAGYLGKLPGIIKVNQNYINIKSKLIGTADDPAERTVMLVLTDITEKQTTEDQVLYLSFHDKLTSLYNRAYVDSIIPQLQLESVLPISVIMADMNGLKLTNDVFGHQSGDRLLINIAQVLLRCCRKKDIVARWGGDEFLIILPGSGNSVCERVCERIRQAASLIGEDPIALSVSLGYATLENRNADLLGLVNVAENMMYSNKLTESKAFRRKIILNLEQTLQTKCFEEPDHMRRLQTLAAQFARELGMVDGSKEWKNLMMLAADHDIGKVTIPREILGKNGRLDSEEWQIVKSHPETGYRMAQSIEEPMLAQAILAVREHYDGTGYPSGLRGAAIPWLSRIIAIVDAYDVMTHDRPYQKKRSPAEAAAELRRCAGRQFDPDLTRIFLDLVVAAVENNQNEPLYFK